MGGSSRLSTELDLLFLWSYRPRTSSAVCFPLEGLSRPLQEPLIASFSLTQDWALAEDQQEAKERGEEGSLGAWTYGFLGG